MEVGRNVVTEWIDRDLWKEGWIDRDWDGLMDGGNSRWMDGERWMDGHQDLDGWMTRDARRSRSGWMDRDRDGWMDRKIERNSR